MAARSGEARMAAVARHVAEIRADLVVMQAALAALAADQARAAADPEASVGDFAARLLGFAHAAGCGLKASGAGDAAAVTKAAERMVGWAEGFLRNPPPPAVMV